MAGINDVPYNTARNTISSPKNNEIYDASKYATTECISNKIYVVTVTRGFDIPSDSLTSAGVCKGIRCPKGSVPVLCHSNSHLNTLSNSFAAVNFMLSKSDGFYNEEALAKYGSANGRDNYVVQFRLINMSTQYVRDADNIGDMLHFNFSARQQIHYVKIPVGTYLYSYMLVSKDAPLKILGPISNPSQAKSTDDASDAGSDTDSDDSDSDSDSDDSDSDDSSGSDNCASGSELPLVSTSDLNPDIVIKKGHQLYKGDIYVRFKPAQDLIVVGKVRPPVNSASSTSEHQTESRAKLASTIVDVVTTVFNTGVSLNDIGITKYKHLFDRQNVTIVYIEASSVGPDTRVPHPTVVTNLNEPICLFINYHQPFLNNSHGDYHYINRGKECEEVLSPYIQQTTHFNQRDLSLYEEYRDVEVNRGPLFKLTITNVLTHKSTKMPSDCYHKDSEDSDDE